MIKEFLDKIFKLPPLEERKDIDQSFPYKLFRAGRSSLPQKDDVYLYCIAGVSCFWIYLTFSAIFLFVYLTKTDVHFGSFHIFYPQQLDSEKFVMEFFRQYSIITTVAAYGLILPFFIAKFLWNINPKKYDIFWFNPRYDDPSKRKPVEILSLGMVGIGMLFIVYFYSYMGLGFIAKFQGLDFLFPRGLFILVFSLLLPWVLAFGMTVNLIISIVFVHFIGKRAGY